MIDLPPKESHTAYLITAMIFLIFFLITLNVYLLGAFILFFTIGELKYQKHKDLRSNV